MPMFKDSQESYQRQLG